MKVFFIMPKSNVLFFGLGRLGYQMSSHLSKVKNINLFIHNRTKNKFISWSINNKATYFDYDSLLKIDYVITCVKDDKAVNDVLTNKKLVKNLHKKTIIIDHSTISIIQVKKLNNYFLKRNISFYDAPVTGGEEGAKNACLSSMIGGPSNHFGLIKKLISVYCKNIIYMGKSGSGQLSKFSNQILICGILISISEAIKFNKINKLDQNKFYHAVINGAAGSWQLKNRFPTMIKGEFNFGFSSELMAKDLKYVIAHAKKMNIDLSLTKKSLKLYNKLAKSKFKNDDTSSILKLI
ncbi:MAG: NAD(P)-dependent oxidoreductase [Alphaproteobacteria bacterium]|nr:NAD(P)-dependent oxidoreductase [Alphaproteobacteria bacterium]